MKTLFVIALISCTTLFAAERCEISPQIKAVKECVGKYSNENLGVQEVYTSFSAELMQAYSRGEGMIDKDVCRILDGVSFAAEKHKLQTRSDQAKTPYIIHPIGVAHHLLLIGKVRDPDILIAALLHDTVEDTNTSFDEIRTSFGERVESFVREVTDDKSLPKEERKRLQIVHAKEKSAGAAQIKLGDKLYNLTDLSISPPPDWTKERVDAYFDWAALVVGNLPWVNAPLKQAVDDIINSHIVD